ncbi:hypothetical protein F4678DRAFT_459274 [Xylaria arbuscula]|nr:hypothetical protein F4678DRAFT_459274 [Xylaria arbuscula]
MPDRTWLLASSASIVVGYVGGSLRLLESRRKGLRTKEPGLQNLFPEERLLTEQNPDSQEGKVFIVTGGNGDLDKERTKILYSKHAKVYVATRSEPKAKEAIEEVCQLYPTSKGDRVYLYSDLTDLATIEKSADDVLFKNASVTALPAGSKTAQDYELQLNWAVRAEWVSLSAANSAPKPAINFTNMDYKRDEDQWRKYERNKARIVLHSCEASKRKASATAMVFFIS